MSKVILVAIVALFSTVSFSQEESKTFKLGARLSYQMQSTSVEVYEIGFMGWGGGIKAVVPIASSISFSPELNILYRALKDMIYVTA